MGETIVTILLKILGWYLDYSESSKAAKKAYLNFVKAMEPHMKSATRLRESYQSQRNANLEKIKKLDETKPN